MLVGRSTGGIGTHVADLAARLRDLGDRVVVVTDPLTADRFDFGEDVRRWWPRARRAVSGDVRRLRAVSRDADVVHAHGHQAGLVAVLAARGRDAPTVVVSLHNEVPGGRLRWLWSAVARYVARHADLVSGASSDLVQRAEADGAAHVVLAPVPSPRVPALLAAPPFTPDERVAEREGLLRSIRSDADPRRPLVLTVSRIAPQKDLDTLVRAAAALTHDATWVVVGDGDPELLERLEQPARAAGVVFAGSRPEVDRWLRAADVFALSSRWEARALVVQEAMAAGTPVVTTDTGGLRDLVGGTGILVPVGAGEELAAAVDHLLARPELATRLASEAREVAAGWPDSEQTAVQWRAWYADATA